MKLAFIIFDSITWLDFFGIYDPLSRLRSSNFLPDLTWDVCSLSALAADKFGLAVKPGRVGESLAGYDAVIVPGGRGTRHLQFDTDFIDWIKTASKATYKISICSGSLILGAAGFLADKAATTHFTEYENLEKYCGRVLRQRIVEDQDVITAGAVSSSIDLGLYLCDKWASANVASEIRRQMAYRG